jgi:hypothetical protein
MPTPSFELAIGMIDLLYKSGDYEEALTGLRIMKRCKIFKKKPQQKNINALIGCCERQIKTISDDTIVCGIMCIACKYILPPHTVKQHLDITFVESLHKCPHN